jgi:hypothetical protein
MRGVAGAWVLGVSLCVSTLCSAAPAAAQFRITDDRGGQIGPYLKQFAMLRDTGSRVVIDGTCLSACTLVLGTVPRDRICVTSRANLGFHAAWNPSPNGRPVYSAEGTRLLWDVYPSNIRNWIKRQGGLKAKMIFLRGKELASMYATCPGSEQPQVTTASNRTNNSGRTARASSGRSVFAATR